MSRSYYRGLRDNSSMHTQRLLAAEFVWMVGPSGDIRKLDPQEFRDALEDPALRGVRFCLTEREADAEGAKRGARKEGAAPSASKGFADFLDSLRGGSVYLVDRAGTVQVLSVVAYAGIPSAALEGSRVFTQEENARAYAAGVTGRATGGGGLPTKG